MRTKWSGNPNRALRQSELYGRILTADPADEEFIHENEPE